MKVFRNIKEESGVVKKEVFDIIECTYSGKFMGERSITATINWPSPIDFQIGDYVDLEMQSLMRGAGGQHGDTELVERFYIYTMPTIKKTSSVNTSSKGFEHIVTFYPAQHELASVQMRDMGNNMSADSIIYTGFDTVTFYGGAFELMERIMSVLKAAYHDEDGNALWNYEIADSVNEQKNTALERFPFSFSGNTVMDALLKLSDKEGINTTFYINNRTIYVGFKRPYFCRVTDGGTIDTNLSTQTFSFKYGKTSHLSKAIDNGGLYEITKTVGKELPITKLFAYGASRNLNRYYCSDRIASGRYVNRVMLPSFDIDGKTDYIISEDAANKYGIREASKQFEDIYPSLRYMTYGDLRTIKYCIKVKASGLEGDSINNPSYNVARIQCYKVVEGSNGVNTLVEAAPQDDLAVFVHAEGKIVKVVLYGGMTDEDAIAKQRQHDAKVPTRDGANDYIPGSCFLVHDSGFGNHGELSRNDWFKDAESGNYTDKQKEEIKLRQINYTDTFWLTDLYVFQSYDQTYFSRDGYSAWSWPRLNSKYTTGNGSTAPDSTLVNTILGVEPITIVDTSMTAADLDKQQKTFDIYLGDTGFKIDEQNDFGEMVFVVAGTVKVSILDGLLAGREFEVNGAVTDSQFSCICAYNDDGSRNDEFFKASGYSGDDIPQKAFNDGAIWRLRLNRINLDEPDYSNLNIALPNTQINASDGDHLVLLDIFMPDIYIHAAENRLLREARKYLEANDNGTVNYAVTFDKVRMHQVSMYGLQMREGLNVRMIDEDLDMRTENDGRYIVDYKDNPLVTTKDVPIVERVWEYTSDYVSAKATVGSELVIEVVLPYEENWLKNPPIRIVQNGTNYDLGRPKRTQSTGWSDKKGGYVYLIYYNKPSGIDFNASYQIYRNQIVQGETSEIWLSSNQAIDFTKGKYYTVNLRVKDNGYVNPDKDSFLLLQSRNDELMSYKPSDSVVSYHRKDGEHYLYITVRFHLEDSFNDNVLYYPSLLYTIDGREPYIGIQLISVHERDYYDNSDILPYADFTIDSITTKIYDSSNREDSRLVREISATLSEQHNATAWASLMNRVENTEKESENNKLTYQEIINTARRHYQTLLNLRNSIFDPDGTCDQTFLQVMMLQIGADSMNYQLRKTRTGFTSDGELAFLNCSCQKESDGYFHFVVDEADTLDHYVFTDGEHDGTWEIPSGIDATLLPNGDGIYQPYFISIRCPKNGGDAQWVCETVQRKVNEDAEAWYFNWGILTVDSGGIYTLVETRGNAYMYGDNLICGKISDMAQRCYFDLTKGEFALGMNPDGSASLKYIDGVLTISGVPNEETINETIEKLLGEQLIGGENLFRGENWADWGYRANSFEHILRSDDLGAGKYVMTGQVYSTYSGCKVVAQYIDGTTEEMFSDPTKANLSPSATEDNLITMSLGITLDLTFEMKSDGYVYIVPTGRNTNNYYRIALVEVMLQKGDMATAYQPYVNHLTKALRGQTDVAGGLLATSVILLRDGEEVTAGMSGVKDDNILLFGGGSYSEAVNAASSPTYDKGDGKPITSLLKKDGTGKIGAFYVDENTIEVKPSSGMPVTITTKSISECGAEKNNGVVTYKDSIGSKTEPSSTETIQVASITIPTYTTVRLAVGNIIMGYELGSSGGSLTPYVDATLTINVIRANGAIAKTYTEKLDSKNPLVYTDTLVNTKYTNNGSPLGITNIEILVTVNHFYGVANIQFDYLLGNKSDSKKCVFARDGMIISCGLNQRFIIKPDSDILSIIADIPDLSSVDTYAEKQAIIKSLEVGQLYTDSSGIVRRFSNEDYNAYIVSDYYRALEFESLCNIMRSGNAKRDTIDIKGFYQIQGNFADTE